MSHSRRDFLVFCNKTVALTAIITSTPSLLLSGCGSSKIVTALPKNSKVTALGDSLTFGYGVRERGKPSNGADYPAKLAQLTGWQIKNEGINGDTSQDILNRLSSIIDDSPKLVLLGIGGNDVLQKVTPATTSTNITSIITQLQQANIPVVLIAQPYFSASALLGKASDNPIYEDIAKTQEVPLFAKAWSQILSDKSLKSDQIHANALGYQTFADMFYEYLNKIGYVL